MKLRAIHNSFIFAFVDAVNSKGQFLKDATSSGIILNASFDDSAKQSRWVQIVSVGSECKDISVGDCVLLPALRWTEAAKIDDSRIWKSDETQVVAKINNSNEVEPLGSYIVFTQNVPTEHRSSSGLVIVIGNTEDTPTGNVVTIGPKVSRDLMNTTILYSSDNFFDIFEHDNKKYAFIKEESILAYIPSIQEEASL